MIEIQWQPDRKFLRQFTGLFLLFFAVVGAIQFFRHGSLERALIVWGVATTIGVIGLFAPNFMRYVYLGWMLAIFPFAWLVSYLILSGVFYLVVTPVGAIMRLLGRDPLSRRFDQSAKTYWIVRQPTERIDRYFRQF